MNTIDRDKISALLVKLRRSKDYSREDMSHLLGVSPRTIQRWEKGDVMPTMDDLVNISNEFNISIEELFAGETNADKELGRQLSKYNTSMEEINTRMSTAEQDINSLGAEMTEMINKFQADKGSKISLSKLCLILAVLHALSALFSSSFFLLHSTGLNMVFVGSILYVCAVSALLWKNRNNSDFVKVMSIYSVLSGINMTVNYVYYVNYLSYGFVSNIEMMIINGPVYGLAYLNPYNMGFLLSISVLLYMCWAGVSIYQLMHKKQKTI